MGRRAFKKRLKKEIVREVSVVYFIFVMLQKLLHVNNRPLLSPVPGLAVLRPEKTVGPVRLRRLAKHWGEAVVSRWGMAGLYDHAARERRTPRYKGDPRRLCKRNTEGAEAGITEDSRFLVFHIKPFYRDTREARIRKKTPDQFPKDSLAWIELGTDRLTLIPRVKSYRLPEKNGEWLAYPYNSVVSAARPYAKP